MSMPDSFFQRPLGLFLSGGGALGSWQASALAAMEEKCGPIFDSVMGFSAGALTGAAYFLGETHEAVKTWQKVDHKVMKFSPRIMPFALYSSPPLGHLLEEAHDEVHAKKVGRCRLAIVSSCRALDKPVYAVFTPEGRDGWDSPLDKHLLASCAIPAIFPPVSLKYRGHKLSLVDGGVPMGQALSLDELGECKDVVIVAMTRPEEAGLPRKWLNPFDQIGRETMMYLVNQAIKSLKKRKHPPRIFLMMPSKVLDFGMLNFKPAKIDQAIALGASDAADFLSDPARSLVP